MDVDLDFAIKGNSGCRVEMDWLDGECVVRKSTTDVNYIQRLRKQIQIQRQFFSDAEGSVFHAPKIISESLDSVSYEACMEYVPYSDFIDFFQYSDISQIRSCIDAIVDFIRSNVSKDFFRCNEFVSEKLEQVFSTVQPEVLDSDFKKIQCRIKDYVSSREVLLPGGRTHGDLTFSNIMFGLFSKRICLIDFLDSYIESPYMDFVKLRQDSQFKWSLLKVGKDYDKVRVVQVLDWIDQYLEINFPMDKELYGILQAVNMLRILPYSKSMDEVEFIKKSILRLEF